MVNILLDGYMFDAEWLFNDLKNYIKPHHKVLVVALSYRDNRVKDTSDWDNLYCKSGGKFYQGITDSFKSYGMEEENVDFLNYFNDSKEIAQSKVISADILYFLGGLPDRMYERLVKFELIDLMKKHNGIVMGYSAGAVIQLLEYHLTPDDDYANFSYYKGIPYINEFFIEVHYENTDIQNESIKRVLAEKQKPVYAMSEMGAIIVDNGEIKTIGDVRIFKTK